MDVTRVEPLGLFEVRLALLPLASSPCHIGERFKNATVIGQELICLLKVTPRSVVILQAGVVILSLSPHGLAQIGLKSVSGFGRLPRPFAEVGRWLNNLLM